MRNDHLHPIFQGLVNSITPHIKGDAMETQRTTVEIEFDLFEDGWIRFDRETVYRMINYVYGADADGNRGERRTAADIQTDTYDNVDIYGDKGEWLPIKAYPIDVQRAAYEVINAWMCANEAEIKIYE